MNRRKAFLALSLLLRMASGLASLLLLARGLGPADYGFVVTIFAYGAIAALLTDFGAPIRLLRDVGAEPQRAGELVAMCLRIKTALLLVASVTLAIALLWLRPGLPALEAGVLLYASILVLSYGDVALVGLRAQGHAGLEAGVVLAGTLAFVAALALTTFSGDMLLVAAAILAARLMQAVLAFLVLRRLVRLGPCLKWPTRNELRAGSGLALDTVLTALSGQIDLVLVSAVLGFEASGLYQVAARTAAYALLPSQVLANAYTPMLSRLHREAGNAASLERQMRFEFVLYGAGLGALVAMVMPLLGPWLFGPAFDAPAALWIGFGAWVFARFAIGGLGIALVARRAVRARLVGQGLGLVVILGGFVFVAPVWGILAAPWVMVAATLATATIYAIALSGDQATTSSRWRMTA